MTLRKILFIIIGFSLIFILITFYIISILAKTEAKQKINYFQVNSLEETIKTKAKQLITKYKTTQLPQRSPDNITETFIKNLKTINKIDNFETVWNQINDDIHDNILFNYASKHLGTALEALRTARVIYADTDSRGTQLKLLLTLEGGAQAVFKPQWYPIDKIITGSVYAGKDRFHSEIIAFYLSAVLDLRSTPLSVFRTIDLESDIYPVATKRLQNTIVQREDDVWCVYGICHYCKPTELACSHTNDGLQGVLIYHIPGNLKLHTSPWRRTYKKNRLSQWQTDNDYCKIVQKKLPANELLDLIDAAIFDFLLQNGDRHHYETIKRKIVLLDNGKGLGNPHVSHLDILAPLYQCCRIRQKTWDRLLTLAGGNFRKHLESILEDQEPPIITDEHLQAIENRLVEIYSAVELCQERFPNENIFI